MNENADITSIEETSIGTRPWYKPDFSLRNILLIGVFGVLGIILNKVNLLHNEMTTESVENLLGFPVIGEIPQSDSIKQAQLMKNPLVYSNPKSEIAVAFNKISEKLK